MARKKRKPEPLTGEALVRAAVANEKLVAESNAAFDRFMAGERRIVISASDLKAWLDDPSRPPPYRACAG